MARGITLVAALAALTLPAQAVAANGTFAGTLGIGVPKGGKATVRAIDAETGRVAVVRDVGRTGRFSLSLPPGGYVVQGVVLPKRGKPERQAVAAILKSGQRRTGAKLTATRKQPAKKKAKTSYRQERGNRVPGVVAAAIQKFSGPSGSSDLAYFGQGIGSMLVTDVVQAVQAGCADKAVLREVERIADIIKENELANSPYADRKSFRPRNLIQQDVDVRGSVTAAAGGNVKVTATITDAKGRSFGTFTVTSKGGDWFAAEQALAAQISAKLCKLRESYEVTLHVDGSSALGSHSGTGTIDKTFKLVLDDRPWEFVDSLQWASLTATTGTECPMVDPVSTAVAWRAELTDNGSSFDLDWLPGGGVQYFATASIDCPPSGDPPFDPPPAPGMGLLVLGGIGPTPAKIPYDGGTVAVSGGLPGFTNTGTITVKQPEIVEVS